MTGKLYCTNCEGHHDYDPNLDYTGDNEIKDRSGGMTLDYYICQNCLNEILKKHFEANPQYYKKDNIEKLKAEILDLHKVIDARDIIIKDLQDDTDSRVITLRVENTRLTNLLKDLEESL